MKTKNPIIYFIAIIAIPFVFYIKNWVGGPSYKEKIAEPKVNTELNNKDEGIITFGWVSSITISVMCILFVIGFVVVHRRRQLILKNELAKLTVLKLQMNAHSVAGALNSIDYYLLNNGKEKASEYLSSYAEHIREMMITSPLPERSLTEELKLCHKYLEMESIRLDNCFDYEINVDKSIDMETLFPCMLLLPIVENTVTHGIQSLMETNAERKGKIVIVIHQNQDTLVCRVSDNGMGLNYEIACEGHHKSYSGGALQERMAIYNKFNRYKMSYTLENDEQGAVAVLSYKIPEPEPEED